MYNVNMNKLLIIILIILLVLVTCKESLGILGHNATEEDGVSLAPAPLHILPKGVKKVRFDVGEEE